MSARRTIAAPPDARARDEIPLGERRIATALFSDLSDYTTLSEALDPEEVAQVMNRLKRMATSIVEGYGGIVNQFAGDEVMALFGVHRVHDDDPIRAVRAGFELHAAVREIGDELEHRLGRALRLHTAVCTGLMVSQLRDRRDGIYGVTGNAVNTAARLAKEAGPDEILTGPVTWHAIRELFETKCLGPRLLRGRAEPIIPYRVIGPAKSRHPARSDLQWDALHGRHAELEALRGFFEHCEAGRARLVAVSGEPGVGKTRLFREFARQMSEQALVLRGLCPSFGAVAPYQPFRDVLRAALLPPGGEGSEVERVVSRVRALGPECEPHLPTLLTLLSIQVDASPLPSEAASDRTQEAFPDALLALFAGLARERSLILLLEDWHWADPASEQVLERLIERLADQPVLLLVNFRSHFEPTWKVDAERMELEPLGIEETRAMLQSILGEVPESLLQRVHQRTGGNPLFVEELCQSVRELGDAYGFSARTVIGDVVPDSVSAVVRARIDRLPPAHVELLTLAAVLGEEFSHALLEKTWGPTERLALPLEGLVRADLLVQQPDGETWRFKHAIVQEVAYAMLLLNKRRALHHAVGCAIEELAGVRVEGWIERLAHHFARSDDRERAVFYLERSGDKAVCSGAMVQALGHYREAIEILDELPRTNEQMRRRIDLTQKLASTAIYHPWRSVRGILDLSYKFAKRLGDARAERRGLYWMGWLDSSLGCWPEAIATFQRCIPLAEAGGDTRLLAQLYSNLGQAYFHGSNYPSAVAHLERAISLRRSVGSDLSAAPIVAYSQGHLALIDCEVGRFDSADARLEEAFKLASLTGQLQLEGALQAMRVTVELFRGDWPACRSAADALLPKAQSIGSTFMLAMSRNLGGLARFMLGEVDAGIAGMREGVEMMQRAQNGMNLSLLYACLASALASLGVANEAEDLAWRALRRADTGDRIGEPSARRVLLMLAAQRSPRGGPEVDAALDAAVAAARRRGSPREEAVSWLTAGVVLGAARDLSWRREVVSDQIERLVAMQMPWYAAQATAILAALPETND